MASPLLIICFDHEHADAMATLARNLGYPDADVVIGGSAEAIEMLNARPTPPEYLLIDIGSHGEEIFPELDQIALHCEATVQVAIAGTINDVNFYRALKNRGVPEYFTHPLQPADVRSVLFNAQAQMHAADGIRLGTVICCMSAASGDGASTIAVNLAYCLADVFKQPTVLVDMDYQFGLIAKGLDLSAPFGIRELFDHPDRGLDDMLIDKMLVKYGDRLNIIASPNDLRLMPTVRPEIIRELIALLRAKFAFVIIDVPHVWTDWTAAAIGYCDHTIMVAQLWLRSLTHASRLFAAWQAIGISPTNTSLIINRSGAKFKEAITAQDFERICHQKISGHVNNDVKAVVNAENHGKTLFETGQSVIIQQQIRQLAQRLVERYLGSAAPMAPLVAPGGKKKLLALFDKRS